MFSYNSDYVTSCITSNPHEWATRTLNLDKLNIVVYIPGSVLHVILTAENERHVHPHVVKRHSPIFCHPFPIVGMDKFAFEVENIRVIRCYIVSVSHHRGLHFSMSLFRIPVTSTSVHSSYTFRNITLIIT